MIVAVLATVIGLNAPVGDILLIARDGRDKLSETERVALAEPTAKSLGALAEEGFIIAEIEKGVTLAIDPLAPPLNVIARERLLLEAFSNFESTKKLSEFDRATQRVVRDLIAQICPNRDPGADTQFMVRSQARFNLKMSNATKTYTATYQLSGPKVGEAMRVLAAGPLKIVDRDPNMTDRGRSSAELVDNAMPWITYEWRVEIYKKCQERIIQQLDVELKARNDAMAAALKKIPGAPDATFGKGDVSDENLAAMRGTFVRSFGVYGYGSEEEAAAAWDSATWGSGSVAFTLLFGDTSSDIGGNPIVGGFEFGNGGR